jgi:hypothetical protein
MPRPGRPARPGARSSQSTMDEFHDNSDSCPWPWKVSAGRRTPPLHRSSTPDGSERRNRGRRSSDRRRHCRSEGRSITAPRRLTPAALPRPRPPVWPCNRERPHRCHDTAARSRRHSRRSCGSHSRCPVLACLAQDRRIRILDGPSADAPLTAGPEGLRTPGPQRQRIKADSVQAAVDSLQPGKLVNYPGDAFGHPRSLLLTLRSFQPELAGQRGWCGRPRMRRPFTATAAVTARCARALACLRARSGSHHGSFRVMAWSPLFRTF